MAARNQVEDGIREREQLVSIVGADDVHSPWSEPLRGQSEVRTVALGSHQQRWQISECCEHFPAP
jgi:hypothetical protein